MKCRIGVHYISSEPERAFEVGGCPRDMYSGVWITERTVMGYLIRYLLRPVNPLVRIRQDLS